MHNNTDAHPNNLQFNTTTIIQDPIPDFIDYDTIYSYALAQHSTPALILNTLFTGDDDIRPAARAKGDSGHPHNTPQLMRTRGSLQRGTGMQRADCNATPKGMTQKGGQTWKAKVEAIVPTGAEPSVACRVDGDASSGAKSLRAG